MDDLESDELAGGTAGADLQLPYLDVDAPGFTWPAHPAVSLPPLAPLEPVDGLRADEPAAPVQLKRDRNTLRSQADEDLLQSEPAEADAALPTRRSLREARATEPHVVRTITMSQPIIPEPHETPVLAPPAAEPEADEKERRALAEDLEAALFAALDEADPEVPEVTEPSVRQARLARAMELVNEGPSGSDPAAPAAATADVSYLSMIKAYGPFPVLRPTHRDFRPLLLLSVVLGILGADRFYQGKHVTCALKLATAGGLGIWWVADIINILRGHAEDNGGHRFTGEKKHRAIAWALVAALFAGLAATAVAAAVPTVITASDEVKEVLKPAPVPTWNVLAEVAGAKEPIVLTITGDRLRVSYDFPVPVYAYLQKEGDASVPAQPFLLTDTPTKGEKEVAVTPGVYQLVVRADNDFWTLRAEELVLRG